MGATGLEPATSGLTGDFERPRRLPTIRAQLLLFMRASGLLAIPLVQLSGPDSRLLPVCCPHRAIMYSGESSGGVPPHRIAGVL